MIFVKIRKMFRIFQKITQKNCSNSGIGSYGVAIAAHVHKKPFYVVCESFKFMRSYPMKQAQVDQKELLFLHLVYISAQLVCFLVTISTSIVNWVVCRRKYGHFKATYVLCFSSLAMFLIFRKKHGRNGSKNTGYLESFEISIEN